ncbi:MAG: V-type ATPase 116kDa subunit family protein [Coriobacteriia bacterium]|nr:V-type ATPase 116kDa subunit family protein [Coriobacteriia bacterium]
MSRVEVVGYRPVLDDVLQALQRAGVLEVDAAPEGLDTEEIDVADDRHRRLEEYAADARFVCDFLARHHTATQPFSAFVSEKIHLSAAEFDSLDPGASLLHLYRRCAEIADRTASLERERLRLTSLVADLAPWSDVRMQISQWSGTEHVALLAGTVRTSEAERVRAALREISPDVSVAEYGGAGPRSAWIVLAHHSVLEPVRSMLATTTFVETSFPGLQDYPAEESSRASDRIVAIDGEIAELGALATELAAAHYTDSVALLERIETRAASMKVRERFGRTERAFVVRGWVRESRRGDLNAALAPWAGDLDIAFSEPTDEDSPPVQLDNPAWLRPFEILTDLYGSPNYRELDPTPLLAPFFLLFFSICISDVGYGAMLASGAYYIKTKVDVAPGVKKFMDLMIIGGFGAMVVGVLFGSWFALPVDSLPPLLRSLQVFDPMLQLTTFLIGTVVLGCIQVFFGVLVAAYAAWRGGDAGAAIFEQLSTLFLFAMIAVAVVVKGSAGWALSVGIVGTMLMQGRSLETSLGDPEAPLWDRAVGWAWLAGMAASVVAMATVSVATGLGVVFAVSMLALVSRTGRRSVVSLLGGAYSVYGMSAFIGDILSYTRLAALGLSGALVGSVFNLLAGRVWGPVEGLWGGGGFGMVGAVIVAVLAATVFVVGHVFNVVINLLGAFVHPARLQFVEFFSKFYEGGGRVFDPFRLKTKSVMLGEPRAAGQEGGTGS